MNYPTHLSAHPAFVIAQISDLHLSTYDTTNFDKFLAVLHLALSHQPDLLLLTGDLVNNGICHLYDELFDVLKKTHIPFLCLAGNHDVTHEMGHHLPFHEHTFLPIQANHRLIDAHRLIIQLPTISWQILAVNSAVNGQIYGQLHDDKLTFLKTHLTHDMPTMIAMHHHPTPVGSAWIDRHILANHHQFWATLAHAKRHPHVICGHVHQAHTLPYKHGTLYTCPATSVQFCPHQDEFGIDDATSGFRLLQLQNDGSLTTKIHRLI